MEHFGRLLSAALLSAIAGCSAGSGDAGAAATSDVVSTDVAIRASIDGAPMRVLGSTSYLSDGVTFESLHVRVEGPGVADGTEIVAFAGAAGVGCGTDSVGDTSPFAKNDVWLYMVDANEGNLFRQNPSKQGGACGFTVRTLTRGPNGRFVGSFHGAVDSGILTRKFQLDLDFDVPEHHTQGDPYAGQDEEP